MADKTYKVTMALVKSSGKRIKLVQAEFSVSDKTASNSKALAREARKVYHQMEKQYIEFSLEEA